MTMQAGLTEPVIPTFAVRDRLIKARETAGLSQAEMGEEIGASRATVSRWERGSGIRKSTLLLYSMRTGVPVEWLETGKYTPRDLNPEPTDYGSEPPALRHLSLVAA